MSSYDKKHPRGTKFTAKELKMHRDAWYQAAGTTAPLNYDERHRLLDAKTFRRVLSVLPYDGQIRVMRTFSFAFWNEQDEVCMQIMALPKTTQITEDPKFEFIDTDLEGLRAEVFDGIDAYYALALRFGREWRKGSGDSAKKGDAIALEGMALGKGIAERYVALIRMARRRIGIDE